MEVTLRGRIDQEAVGRGALAVVDHDCIGEREQGMRQHLNWAIVTLPLSWPSAE